MALVLSVLVVVNPGSVVFKVTNFMIKIDLPN